MTSVAEQYHLCPCTQLTACRDLLLLPMRFGLQFSKDPSASAATVGSRTLTRISIRGRLPSALRRLPSTRMKCPTPPSATTVGRARCAVLRFDHAPASAAYPRDPRAMRTRLRMRLAAHTACARADYAILICGTLGDGRVELTGRTTSSARTCPSFA